MTAIEQGNQLLSGDVDPVHLTGEELFRHIATRGLAYTVSADPIGADFVHDVEERLGHWLKEVTVSFTSDPENNDNLIASFSPATEH